MQSRIGYGAMRLTGPGNFGPPADRAAAVALVRQAAELGVVHFDTADAYGPGDSESILAEALAPFGDAVTVATKGGAVKTAPGKVHFDGSAAHLRNALEGSLRRLGRERIDLYYLHRPDPKVPFRESVRALAAFRDEGLIANIGLSNVSVAQLAEAQSIAPITAVQNRYSVLHRESEALVNATAQSGVRFVAYAPLAAAPFERRAALASGGPLDGIAHELGVSGAQLALAWLLHRAPHLTPIPATTRLAHLRANLAAEDLQLDGALQRRIEAAVLPSLERRVR
ncbi:MAG: aldo/keto reductase [Myxococcota bacterium]